MDRKRGAILTIFAVLFALLAVSNFMKPLKMSSEVGFVFLGTRLSGMANAIAGPVFGVILATYAFGIFAMRQFALPIAYLYAAYVIVNLVLYLTKTYATLPNAPLLVGMLLYALIAISVSSGAAIILHQRRAELT
ncbi:MAG: hypothetical protein Q7S58_20375 [Candidatus Binatus sp.]|uniref:hypothetical protein n=1 Tax=Candidatus Binatus sp. TaxID=2811406 RepID=UPI0027230C9C|nr:hypothetical protein [Candidatus Binatus sp.]MDO8434760.1 hypothetical protein [Candidatus Binatus sp.]